ncbi:MAG: hypothetical protein ABSA03_10650 [Streptosporangiaceae bacterium]
MSSFRDVRLLLLRNWIFCTAFTLGLAVRAVTMLGFPPAIWFGGDSASYLSTALRLTPGTSRQSGYGILLFALRPAHSFLVVTGVQHLMGLAIAVMIYALLRRYGLPRWGATLAALPVLLDAYQIQLEQEILADAAFGFLVVAALTLLLWWRDGRPLWATAAAALLLGCAADMWPTGLPLLILLVLYLIIRKAGWRALTAALAAGALPLVIYLGWFDSAYHKVAFNFSDGVFLWSRTMTFADCAIIKPPADEAKLCPRVPVATRPAASIFIWEKNSPLDSLPGGKFSPGKNALAMNFAFRAIAAQPGAYVKDVLDDFALTFTWNRPPHPSAQYRDRYQFSYATSNWAGPGTARSLAREQRRYTGGSLAATRATAPFAGWMRSYQRFAYVRGTMLAVLLLIGLAALARSWTGGGPGRRRERGGRNGRGRRDSGDSQGGRDGWGGPALLPWATAMAILLIPNVTADFSERYVVPALPLACLAAAFAFLPRRALPRPEPGAVTSGAQEPPVTETAPLA